MGVEHARVVYIIPARGTWTMIEDEAYKILDRKYKKGVVMDNPISLIVDLED